ncbi:hypothetical protein EMIT0P74_50375 [Pseudomonas sp. IT-P74]
MHPAFCAVVRRFDGTIACAGVHDWPCINRRSRSQIQNISKTACTAQEPLTYFRAQSSQPDNKKIEREHHESHVERHDYLEHDAPQVAFHRQGHPSGGERHEGRQRQGPDPSVWFGLEFRASHVAQPGWSGAVGR